MKIKELQKTVNVAWSPLPQNPIFLAAGSAAQQLDTSAPSVLEIYSTNLQDPGYDLELKAAQPSEYRFQKVVWSPTGFGSTHPNGLIIGGCEGGHLMIYSAQKMLSGKDGLIGQQDMHTGAIKGIDFNPFQQNLLASVASESEIFIWDLNNIATPMSPGTKSQPLEDVLNVAWNKQVQHILASVFSTRCVIWDLRKNQEIIKLSDTQSRVRWSAMQWHPEIATQLWLASEDDQAPVVQLWDLRYATSPAKTLQIHQRGVLGLTWCPRDSDLMVSCGKDNKIFCWNPNSESSEGEILSEIATTVQWYSDVQWCPKNPALIAGSSLEGNISIYSLYGGTQQHVQTSNKIADSFPGMDQFAQAPILQQTTHTIYHDLTKAPKWMKRPAGVSFGFGGRLVAYNQKSNKTVLVNQIITEQDLVDRANSLEKTLEEGNYSDYCREKADQMTDQHGRFLWYFLKANFELNPREEMLNLLGYNKDDTTNKFQKYVKESTNDINQITDRLETLTHSDSSEVECDQSTDESTDLSGGDNLFDNISAGTRTLNDKLSKKEAEYKIPTGEDTEGLISEAILSGNIEAAVELCIDANKNTEALILASTAGIDFLIKIQNRYLHNKEDELSNLISALVTRDWIQLMSQCTIESWKEALVAALTHSDGQMGELCARLGERLQNEERNTSLAKNALLCYICAGDLERLVDSWLQFKKLERNELNLSTSELQELVEIVMLLKKSLELRGNHVEPAGKLAMFLSQYAGLLAAQGALDTALSYLGPTDDPELEDLRERLYYALGHKQQQAGFRKNSMQQQQTIYKPVSNSFKPTVPGFQATHPLNPMPSNPYKTAPAGGITSLQGQHGLTQSSQFYNPNDNLNNVGYPGMSQPVPSKPPTINDNLSQPQRPSSVGSQQGSTSLPRSKYVLDPSVTSLPSFGQPINNLYNPSSMAQSSPFSNQTTYTTNPLLNPLTSSYQPSLMQPTSTGISQQNAFKQFTPTPQGSVSSLSNPSSYLPGIAPIETNQQPLPPPPNNSQRNPTPPPGWNDPPALKSTKHQVFYSQKNEMSAKHAGTRKWQKIINSNSTSKKDVRSTDNQSTHSTHISTSQDSFMFQQNKGDSVNAAPIMHPLFNNDPNQNQNGYYDPNSQFQNPIMQSPPTQTQQTPFSYNQQQNNNQYPNQMNFQTSAVPQVFKPQIYNENQQTVIPQKQQEIPKEKPPLPEEFVYLQTVLEELKNQCLNAAPDPRMKRKFADVGKRLESLYDALREGRLTQSTLTSLNQIVQYLQIGDYGNALATHTMIVSGPDFSQTAAFMPGIKVLVQSAADLKVYLR